MLFSLLPPLPFPSLRLPLLWVLASGLLNNLPSLNRSLRCDRKVTQPRQILPYSVLRFSGEKHTETHGDARFHNNPHMHRLQTCRVYMASSKSETLSSQGSLFPSMRRGLMAFSRIGLKQSRKIWPCGLVCGWVFNLYTWRVQLEDNTQEPVAKRAVAGKGAEQSREGKRDDTHLGPSLRYVGADITCTT